VADPVLIEILSKGPQAWNEWHGRNPHVYRDFRVAKLSGKNLKGCRFNTANFLCAKFKGANLEGADLVQTNLHNADLSFTNLRGADLYHANLKGANLEEADLEGAILGNTQFSFVNLSTTKGLETCTHRHPSSIDHHTLKNSGSLPPVFLEGCGLSDWEIEATKLYAQDLPNATITEILYKIHDLRIHQVIKIGSIFISYSHEDAVFVDKIGTWLKERGIRYWLDRKDATAGRIEKQLDRAIHFHPTVLLILSQYSTNSDWVEHEVRKARELEKETKRDVICPISLDDSWKDCRWPQRIMEQIKEYNILDFSKWENEGKFEREFAKLLNGLSSYY